MNRWGNWGRQRLRILLEVLQPTLCGCTRVINPCKLLEAHRHPLLWDPLSESGTCHLSPLIAPQMLKNLSASGDCHPHASGLIRKAPFLALYNSTNLYHHQQHIPKSPTPETRADDKWKQVVFKLLTPLVLPLYILLTVTLQTHPHPYLSLSGLGVSTCYGWLWCEMLRKIRWPQKYICNTKVTPSIKGLLYL